MKANAVLRLNEIRLDFQPLENLLEDIVLEYIVKIEAGEEILPVRVRFDGSNYFLEDGFHRLEATRRIGANTIRAEVTQGTLEQMEADWREYLNQVKEGL